MNINSANSPAPPETSINSRRIPIIVLSVSTVIASWQLMQVVHEFGHAIAGWATGGIVKRIVLVPWELSRTDLIENPRPLIVAWAGPIVGAAVPFLIWLMVGQFRWYGMSWFHFLAGFCLIANGAYIGIGAITRDGDAGDLLREGSPVWTLLAFGSITSLIGIGVWHRMGVRFGLGRESPSIGWSQALASVVVTATVIAVELIFSTS